MKCAILISLYNAEKTLDRTFESLRLQTYQDFRIIAVNDYSQDSTYQLLQKWQKQFGGNRFLLINNETNLGVTKSSNRGLQEVNEKYVARMDADDWWDKDKLLKQISFLDKKTEYGIIGCNYININKKSSRKIITEKDNVVIKKNIIKKNPFAHSCVVYRTDLIQKIHGYDESIKYGGDYELYLRFFSLTKFYNIQEFLCFRSIEEEGISIKKQREQMLQCVKTKIKYLKLYDRSFLEYRHIIEPLLVALSPEWLRQVKRKLF